MNTKTMAAIGCLAMIGAVLVPSTFAHTQGQNGLMDTNWLRDAPVSGAGPSGWYYGSVSAYAALTTTQTVGGQAQGACADVPDPDAQAACEDLLAPINPSFLFAAAFALCDLEVLGDGATQDPLDEGMVEEVTVTGSMVPDGLFNDGGTGAACHTHGGVEEGDDPAQAGYYDIPEYNEAGCPSGEVASARDLVLDGGVWISTSCDYLHTLDGQGSLTTFTGCASDYVLTGEYLTETMKIVDCTENFVNCVLGTGPCETVGGFTECGADHSAEPGGSFGRGDGTGPLGAPAFPTPALDDAGHDCSAYASAAIFVWNAVDIQFDSPADSTVSVPTHGWLASS